LRLSIKRSSTFETGNHYYLSKFKMTTSDNCRFLVHFLFGYKKANIECIWVVCLYRVTSAQCSMQCHVTVNVYPETRGGENPHDQYPRWRGRAGSYPCWPSLQLCWQRTGAASTDPAWSRPNSPNVQVIIKLLSLPMIVNNKYFLGSKFKIHEVQLSGLYNKRRGRHPLFTGDPITVSQQGGNL